MKKLLPFILILGFIIPIQPANAVFGLGDCKNLAKRINVGQKEYEKAWDKYQTARGKTDFSNILDSEANSRLFFAANISNKMFLDVSKYPKCLRLAKSYFNRDWEKVKLLFRYKYAVDLISDPLPQPFDHKYLLK